MERASQSKLLFLWLVLSFEFLRFKNYLVADKPHFVVAETSAVTLLCLLFLNHKKLVGDWLLIRFKVSYFQTKLVSKRGNLPNKAFKWDSYRVAFLVCGEFWW